MPHAYTHCPPNRGKAMKIFFNTAITAVLLIGCSNVKPVQFAYCNLSTNEISVLNISGISVNVAPGYLMPSRDKTGESDQASLEFYQILEVAHLIQIVWEENGIVHQYEIDREQVSIPSKLEKGKVRFTYLGNRSWRISK
jgi:hypothetical protein